MSRMDAEQPSTDDALRRKLPFGPSTEFSRVKRWRRASEGVEGWFSPMSAALWDGFLGWQHAWSVRGDLLEIGCAHGLSALMLGVHAQPGETTRLIDAAPHHAAAAPQRVWPHSDGQVLGIHAFSERMDSSVLPMRGSRFMHIDGDHGRWALHNDLELAHRVVCDEGLVVLDDFLAPQFGGVTVGAIEWMTRNPEAFQFVLIGFNKAYLCRPRHQQRYLEFLRDGMPAHLRVCGEEDFTFWRTDDRRAFPAFGLTARQFDRDFVSREFAMAEPERLVDGKLAL